jgi:hypothetical protein
MLDQGSPLEPRLGQMVIVVAGHDHHLPLGTEGGPELAQHRRGVGERLGDPRVAQLDDVAEQHESLAVGNRLEQAAEQRRPPKDIGMAA